MVDAHCHLNFKAFENDLDEVIQSAFDKGLKAIINVGSSLETSQKAIKLAEKYENLYATIGVHPHHADKLEKGWEIEFRKLAENPKVVGIGECGLDYYQYKSNGVVNPKIQRDIFLKQIEMARQLKLPLQIHNRHAGKEIIDLLDNHKSLLLNPPGIFHCFSGDIELLKQALNLGFYIGFDGNITYKGKPIGETTDLKDLVKYCPLDRLIVETDAPYLTPVPYRGERNKPEYAIIIIEAISKIKGLSLKEITETIFKNTNYLFRLSYKN